MSNSSLRPYGNIRAKVREYTDKETGKTKGVYIDVGTLFASPHFSHMAIKIDAMPVGLEWNGWLSVYPKENTTQPPEDNNSEVII